MENLSSIYTSTMVVLDEKTESKRPGVLCTLRGPFMVAEDENNNGRWYPKSLIDKCIVNDPTIKKLMESHCLYGEASHPEERFDTELPLVSHAVTKLEWDADGKTLLGEADILDTPSGRIMATLCRYGAKMGVSVRARGNLIELNGRKVPDEETYMAKTFDLVPNPGFEQARLEMVNESVDEKSMELVKELLGYINTAKHSDLSIIQPLFESVTGEFIQVKEQIATRLSDTLSLEESKKDTINEDSVDVEFESLLDENVDLLDKIDGLEASLNEKDALINRLRGEIHTQKKTINEQSRTLSSQKVDSNTILELMNENSKLQERISTLVDAKKQLNESKNSNSIELVSLREKVKMFEKQVSFLTEQVSVYKDRVANLSEQLHDSAEENDLLCETLLEMETLNQKVSKKATKLNESADKKRSPRIPKSKGSYYLNESITAKKTPVVESGKNPENRLSKFILGCSK